MIEKVFRTSRLLVLVTVLVSAVSAVLLYVASIYIVFNMLVDFFQQVPSSADGGKRLAVQLLKVLDTLLIAVTFQIVAAGLYRLFIRPDSCHKSGLISVLEIRDFHDLKITIIQVAIVILVVLFLEQAVETGPSADILYFGAAVALIIASAVFAVKSMGHTQTTRQTGPADEV